MKARFKQILFSWSVLILISLTSICKAGFGISPPYVFNDKLLPGSHHEQQITLVRADSDVKYPAKIFVEINAPEIASWIKIDKGTTFPFPDGERFVNMTVIVDVPPNAELKNYRGRMTANLIQEKEKVAGGSAIVLGAAIDINLTVGNSPISDFSIYSLRLPEFRENMPMILWLGIDNKGNTSGAPSKITADILDISGQQAITTLEAKKVDTINSFTRQEVKAIFNHELKKGSYWAEIKIYQEDKVVRQERLFVSVTPSVDIGNQGLNIEPPNFSQSIIEVIKTNIVLDIVLVLLILIGIFLLIRKLIRR